MKKIVVVSICVVFLAFISVNSFFVRSLLGANCYHVGENGSDVISKISYRPFAYEMTISGKGRMTEHFPTEWANHLIELKDEWKIPIKKVDVAEGVSSISIAAFSYCTKLEYVQLPSSLTEIGSSAFCDCPLLTTLNYKGTVATWETVVEHSPLWNFESNIRSVKCTDGEWEVPQEQ